MKAGYLFYALAFLVISCGDSGGDGDGSGGAPTAALLIGPINNSECITGTPVSTTQTSVTFEWNPAQNADGYFLYVKNLASGTTAQFNAGTNVTYNATLQKGTPYSWYVSSRKEGQTSVASQVWKFYNAGDGVTNYAPFPAEAVFPGISATVTGPQVTLQWSADDVDGDIADYKIYFGTASNPTTLLSTVTQPQLANVAVTAGNTYYWKVVTTDGQGNNSSSQVFQFKAE